MQKIRYELTIKEGNTLRVEKKENKSVEALGYQTFEIIEEGEE